MLNQKLLFTIPLFLTLTLASITGCKHNPQQQPTPKPPQTANAKSSSSTHYNSSTSNNPSSSPSTATPTSTPATHSKPGLGAISGTVRLPSDKRKRGNLFLYILDEKSANFENPVAIASLFIPAEKLKTSEPIPYTLNNLPPGSHSVTAVLDIGKPFCQKTAPYCVVSVDDIAAQSDPATVQPNLESHAPEIDLQ